MFVSSVDDGRPFLLLEDNKEIRAAIRVLNLIRTKTKKGEQQRTWAMIKLYCMWRAI